MRRAIFIVVTVVGIIGAPASPAAPTWQGTTISGKPGNIAPVDYRGAEGGICGDPAAYEPPNCDYLDTAFYQIFIDRLNVYTAGALPGIPYSGYQTIRVDAYLYYYNFNASRWDLFNFPPYRRVTVFAIPPPPFLATFGSPASDVYRCYLVIGGCVPAFARIQGGYYYTIVVDITWYDFYFHNLLAEAHYIPGTNLFTDGYGLTNSNDMGCAPYAMGENPRQPLLRCIPGSAHTSGLPTAFKGVGYLYFP